MPSDAKASVHVKFFAPHIEKMGSNWKTLADKISFVFETRELSAGFPPVVRRYYNESVFGFLTGLFIASTVTSSTCVEVAINLDNRMQDRDRKKVQGRRWFTLSPNSLERAKARGLPIDKLLLEVDNLEARRVTFLITRNKYAHGQLFGKDRVGRLLINNRRDKKELNIILSTTEFDLPLQQLKSAHAFLIALYGPSTGTPHGNPKFAAWKEKPRSSE